MINDIETLEVFQRLCSETLEHHGFKIRQNYMHYGVKTTDFTSRIDRYSMLSDPNYLGYSGSINREAIMLADKFRTMAHTVAQQLNGAAIYDVKVMVVDEPHHFERVAVIRVMHDVSLDAPKPKPVPEEPVEYALQSSRLILD